jgi:hypothetical protein
MERGTEIRRYLSVVAALIVIASSTFVAAAAAGTGAPLLNANVESPQVDSSLLAEATASLREGAGPAAALPFEWQSPVGPGAWAAATMTYDAVDHEVVLFGGMDNSGNPLGDTWVYKSSGWQELFLAVAPPPRYLAAMTYDAKDGYVVLFGGAGSTTSLSDTWEFVDNSWTQLSPSVHPTARYGSTLSYDALDGYSVLFGGYIGSLFQSSSVSETWKFVHGAWTNLTTSQAPAARGEVQMVYDSADHYLLLNGGCSSRDCEDIGSPINDTWSFAGGVWTQLHPHVEPDAIVGGDFMGAITYDAKDGYVLLFGGQYGYNIYGNPGNASWSFLHGQWSRLHPSAVPPARYLSDLTYDPETSTSILLDGCFAENLFGDLGCPVGLVGLTNPDNALQDQWTFSSGRWVQSASPIQPGYDYSASMSYDPHQGYVLFYAGPGSTWEFGGGHWTHLTEASSPPVNGYMAMTYDAKDGYIVLFGGNNVQYGNTPYSFGSFFSSQTWKFQYGRWTELHPAVAPQGRAGASMAYDSADGYVLMFGGGNATQVFGGTWGFAAGQWTKLSPSTHPSARSTAAMAYDAADGYVVLFGGCSVTSCTIGFGKMFGDTWTFAGGQWTLLHSTLAPSARSEVGMAYDGPGVMHGHSTGGVILFGGDSAVSFVVGDTWLFLHGQWNSISPPFSPPFAFGMAFAYDGADGKLLMEGGQSSLTLDNDASANINLSDTWEFAIAT